MLKIKAGLLPLALVQLLLALLTIVRAASVYDFEPVALPIPSRAVSGKPVNSTCDQAIDCQTRNCKSNRCVTPSELYGICKTYKDCDPNLAHQGSIVVLDCYHSTCLKTENSYCGSNTECESGLCVNAYSPTQKVCVQKPQAPNAVCSYDRECLSGTCPSSYYDCVRLNADGSYAECGYSTNYCAPYPLGHACKNQGECDRGACRNGTCSSTVNGDACVTKYTCSGVQLCSSSTKKCYTPPNASIYPTRECEASVQCKSGRCNDTIIQKDEGDLNYGTSIGPLRCDYIPNGKKGCRSTKDCASGLCIDSTCRAGPDGSRCQASYQCLNVCATNGTCYSPTSLLPAKQPCKTASQCQSGKCDVSITYEVSRPSFADPSKNVSYFDDVC